MKYESEFEIVETINSIVTKLQHRYVLLYHIELELGKEESSLKIWDMRANHPVGGTRIKSTNTSRDHVKQMLQKAIARAQHNKRKTVFGGDF